MFVKFALYFAVVAICFELYLLLQFARSKFGKYPPAIPSFGKTKKDMVAVIDDLIAKKGKSDLRIVDLGCGSGNLLLPLAKKHPNHCFYGYEWDVFPYAIAKFLSLHLKNTKVRRCNFMKEDLSGNDIILCYVGNELSEDLGKKLNEEISPETIVVSEVFVLNHLKEERKIETKILGNKSYIHIYRKNEGSE